MTFRLGGIFCYALIVSEIMTHVLFTTNAALFCILIFDGAKIIQLSDNIYNDFSPHINTQGQVVWFGHDGYDFEIFLYDGAKTIQLTDNERNDRNPHMNDNGQVVWEADIGDIEIFLANPN
jgi:hypothetical protein